MKLLLVLFLLVALFSVPSLQQIITYPRSKNVHWRNLKEGQLIYISSDFTVGGTILDDDGIQHYFDTAAIGDILSYDINNWVLTSGGLELIDNDPNVYTVRFRRTGPITSGLSTVFQNIKIVRPNAGVRDLLTLTVVSTNTAPFAPASTIAASLHWRTPTLYNILAGATDANNDPLSLGTTSETPVGCGTLIWDASAQQARFTPSGRLGPCNVDYTITDTVDHSVVRTAQFTVTNTAPTASSFQRSVVWSVTNLEVDALALSNAADANSDPLSLSEVGTMTPAGCANATITGGKLFISKFNIKVGTCVVPFIVTDTIASTAAQATFNFGNRAPVTQPLAQSRAWSAKNFDVDVLSVSSDPDGDLVNFKTLSPGLTCANAQWNSGTNQLTVTKFNIVKGTCFVEFTLWDQVDTVNGNITFTITNSAPVTEPIFVRTHWNVSNLVLAPLQAPYATDADGDSLTIPAFATVLPLSCGSGIWNTVTKRIEYINFTIKKGLCGVKYNVTDSVAITPGSLEYEVYNTPPTFAPITVEKLWNATNVEVDLASNFADADGDRVSYKSLVGLTPANCADISIVNNKLTLAKFNILDGSCAVSFVITDTVDDGTGTVTFNVLSYFPKTTPIKQSKHWRDEKNKVSVLLPAYAFNPSDNGALVFKSIDRMAPSECAQVVWKEDTQELEVIKFNSLRGDCVISYTIGNSRADATGSVTFTITNKAPRVNPIELEHFYDATKLEVDILGNSGDDDYDPVSFKSIDTLAPKDCADVAYVNRKLTVAKFKVKKGVCTVKFTVTDTVDDAEGTVTFKMKDLPPKSASGFNGLSALAVVLMIVCSLLF